MSDNNRLYPEEERLILAGRPDAARASLILFFVIASLFNDPVRLAIFSCSLSLDMVDQAFEYAPLIASRLEKLDDGLASLASAPLTMLNSKLKSLPISLCQLPTRPAGGTMRILFKRRRESISRI
jgi:hypothetical protein